MPVPSLEPLSGRGRRPQQLWACSRVLLACVPSASPVRGPAHPALLTGLGACIWVSRMGPGVGGVLGWDTSDPVVIGPEGPRTHFLPQD